MHRYFVLYGDYDEYFTCLADSAAHAQEQCWDANREPIHGVWLGVQDGDMDVVTLIGELVAWEASMGGFEAPVWEKARMFPGVPPTPPEDLLGRIDLTLLDAQRATLHRLLSRLEDQEEVDDLDGLLNLLDAINDHLRPI